jgi:hypothetical protein
MSASQIQTDIEEARALIRAGDTAGALTVLRGVQVLIAGTPRLRNADGAEIEYLASAVNQMIASLGGAASAAAGIQTQTVTYVRETESCI